MDLSDFKDVSFGSSTTHAKSVVVWSSPMLKVQKRVIKGSFGVKILVQTQI